MSKQHRSAEIARMAVHADVDELLHAMAAVEISDALVKAVEAGGLDQLVKIQTDTDAAVPTGILRVRFEPSDRFRDLVATRRTGED